MMDATLKDKLMSALRVSVDHLNSGSTPNEAVTKAASAGDLNIDQSRRLCELFNTARTLYHFEHSPQHKEASFELSDPDEVLGNIFGADTPPAKVASVMFPDYAEYEGMELMARDGEILGQDIELWPKTAAEEHLSVEDQARRAYRIIDTQRQLVKQAMSECRQAEILASEGLAKLAEEISRDFAMNGPDRYVRLLRARGSKEDRLILKKLAVHLPVYVDVTDADMRAHGPVVESRDLKSWYQHIDTAKSLQYKAASAMAMAKLTEKEAQEFENDFLKVSGVCAPESDPLEEMLAPFIEKRSADGDTYKVPTIDVGGMFRDMTVGDKFDAYTGEKTVKRTPGVRDTLVGGADAAVGKATTDYIQSGIKALQRQGAGEGHKITERLKNQQREVLLQELLTRDPYISEADPYDVINGFQTIMQVAPEVSTNREVVRAVLRQLIHTGALSTFDASSLAQLEKTIQETQGRIPMRKKDSPDKQPSRN